MIIIDGLISHLEEREKRLGVDASNEKSAIRGLINEDKGAQNLFNFRLLEELESALDRIEDLERRVLPNRE